MTKMEMNLKGMYRTFNLVIFLQLILSSGVNMSQESNFLHISKSCSDFTSNLYKVLTLEKQDVKNVASSSLSVYTVLSLLLKGTDGKTKEELKSGLHLNDIDIIQKQLKVLFMRLNNVSDAEIQIANGIHVNKHFEIRKDFLIQSQDNFLTTVEKIVPQNKKDTAQQINEWIKDKTKNKIDNIISPNDIDESTKVILINALYFKSSWLNPFESQFTEKRKFYNMDGTEVYIQTMQKTFSVLYSYVKSLKISFIKIKYLSKEVEMIIILPNDRYGLSELEKNFDWEKISKATYYTKEIELFLPKFQVETTIKLNSVLKKLGISTIFTEKADFSLMAEQPLYVNQILQKVVVEIDEKGSEATAATVAQIRSRRMIVDTEIFTVDHPFMFVIHHIPSSIPLFIGSIRELGANYKDEL